MRSSGDADPRLGLRIRVDHVERNRLAVRLHDANVLAAQGQVSQARELFDRAMEEAPTISGSINEVEFAWIGRVLARCDGNRVQAAKILGIDPSTLWRKLKETER